MKHSKKEKKPKGFSKGKNDDRKRLGPIMIEEILDGVPEYSKYDLTIRELNMRTDPTNEASPIIKRKFKPLDNPSNVLDVLQGILLIKEGVVGNNVTTGPLQYRYWRGCLTGTALDKFNEFTQTVGSETAANLVQVERRLVTFFAPREVLRQQTRYMRFHMRKPKEVTTRQYVGAVSTLNSTLERLPPAFAAGQKVTETDMMDILASKAPKSHKELMTDHGFDPQTATKAEFVEICERAETKEALLDKRSTHNHYSDNDDSSDDNHASKRPKKKPKKESSYKSRSKYYCTEHGPNNTHDTEDCKVLQGRKDKKSDWKKKDTSEGKYNDYKSKYKKKHQELNLLQMETKKEKAKWTKAYKKLKSDEADKVAPDKDDPFASSSSDGDKKPAARARTFTPREHRHEDGTDSSSSESSSSSDDTDSE
jgi:hypothetical protein